MVAIPSMHCDPNKLKNDEMPNDISNVIEELSKLNHCSINQPNECKAKSSFKYKDYSNMNADQLMMELLNLIQMYPEETKSFFNNLSSMFKNMKH